ncbi:MAG: lysine N(6)-hydroxylase/L-ornithine N(5)-oxygenase family protein [Parahaliea sp.]
MTQITTPPLYDMIGVGFGPSNLALAIALEEMGNSPGGINVLFLDKQKHYQWHGETLVSQSDLQISFLKDLVSLRNPESPYSFVNYLHKHQRLVDFINLGTLYPCRMEFNDYLQWTAGHFKELCHYGQEVRSIEPVERNGVVDTLRVISCSASGKDYGFEARSVVVSPGGKPSIPEVFRQLSGDARVFHHAEYKSSVRALEIGASGPARIAIIGAGQSAAEAFIDLNDCYPSVAVDWVIRGSSIKPADDTPFVNEIFAPEFTDLIYQQEASERARYIGEYHNTNYSVVDVDLIERIYGIFYRQKVEGHERHRYRRLMTVEQVEADSDGVWLSLRDKSNGRASRGYDAVILATGYNRTRHHELLSPLAPYLGDYSVGRDYRIETEACFKPAIYMQGFCEPTHGLSDTLLSVLPYRSQEIASSLQQYLQQWQSNSSRKEPFAMALDRA